MISLTRQLTRLTVCAALLGGCSEASYVLRLEPILPENQAELLTDGQVVRLQVDADAGAPGWVDGGALSGDVRVRRVGVLDGSWLGVVVQAEGAKASQFDAASLVAYGELGPLDLAREAEDVVRSVLVASTDGVGSLGSLGEGAVLSAAAVTGSGSVYVFGGTSDTAQATSSAAIHKLVSLDEGGWALSEVGELPVPVVGARASVVEIDGAELIVVTGGQAAYDADFGPYFGQVLLFDPATDEVVWSGELAWQHADHVAVRLGNQRVLLASMNMDGGNAPDVEARLELFNPRARESEPVSGRAGIGGWHAAGTALDDGGALLCGGSLLDPGDNTTDLPTAACDRIDDRGRLEAGPELRGPIQMHAMITLLDGRVLLTGGVEEAVPFGTLGEATAKAWLWDPAEPGRWTAVGDMQFPRALHTMVLRNDGKVWVLGGASQGGLEQPAYDEAPRCPEVFDPETLTFSTAAICHAAGVGARLTVAAHPRQGVVVLEGLRDDGEGGQKLGYLPMGPSL